MIQRPFEEIQLGVMTAYNLASPQCLVSTEFGELIDLGFTRILLAVDPGLSSEQQYEALEQHRKTAAQFS